jgi:hypothetical protein
MIPLHTEFLIKNGKREFAVLPYEEYEQQKRHYQAPENQRIDAVAFHSDVHFLLL